MKRQVSSALFLALSFSAAGAFADVNADLIAAAGKMDLAGVTAAIEAGADVNFESDKKATPLNAAVFSPEITKLLLEKGAKPNSGDIPALTQAVYYYSTEVIDLLLAAGADPNKPMVYKYDNSANLKKMIEDLKAKDAKANKFLIKAFEDQLKNAVGTQSTLAITFASMNNCKGALEKLVKAGADISAKDQFGHSFLHLYVLGAKPVSTIVQNFKAPAYQQPLIDSGAALPDWFKNFDGSRVDSPAAGIKALIAAGQDPKAKNSEGSTVFMAALGYDGISSAHTESLLALIEAGADVREVHEKFGAAITLAVKKGDTALVGAMLKAGASVNTESREFDKNAGQYIDGFTPLTVAAMRDDLPMVRFLLANGALPSNGVAGRSFNIKTGCLTKVKNKTAIYYAIENGNVEMVKLLAEQSAFNWGKAKLIIDQMKMVSEKEMGAWKVVTTTCFKDGEYTPSKFAKALKNKELAKYLDDKDL
ncbi:MAG: ankyrin repeat domain-containing protein [Elusimicrobiales bacterium]